MCRPSGAHLWRRSPERHPSGASGGVATASGEPAGSGAGGGRRALSPRTVPPKPQRRMGAPTKHGTSTGAPERRPPLAPPVAQQPPQPTRLLPPRATAQSTLLSLLDRHRHQNGAAMNDPQPHRVSKRPTPHLLPGRTRDLRRWGSHNTEKCRRERRAGGTGIETGAIARGVVVPTKGARSATPSRRCLLRKEVPEGGGRGPAQTGQ